MNCTFTRLLFYYLMIGFQRLCFIRTYPREVFSLELSYGVLEDYRTQDHFRNQKCLAFQVPLALRMSAFPKWNNFRVGPMCKPKCLLHPCHTYADGREFTWMHLVHQCTTAATMWGWVWHFPPVACCWGAKGFGVSGLGVLSQCMVLIGLSIC